MSFSNNKVVPVLVIEDVETARPLGEALLKNGLPIAEVTLRTEAALGSITEMRTLEGLFVGAGTVLTVEHAEAAIAAGAQFLVSPAVIPDVVKYAQSKHIPIIPGAITPTEVAQAMALGLDTVKFFPAELSGGSSFVKALASIYPEIKVMPTGGISEENIGSYLTLPNVISCGGSWMVPKDLLKEREYEKIGGLINRAVAATHT